MLRRFALCILALLLLITATVSVSATSVSSDLRLCDSEDLLTDYEEELLIQQLDDISSTYQCDVVIVTAADLEGKTPKAYADDYFDFGGYGYGSSNDGILLLVSLQERKWAMSTCGEAIDIFTDADLEYMESCFKPYLSDGEYYEAFEEFVWLCDLELSDYTIHGNRDSSGSSFEFKASWILTAIVIGAAIAFIAVLIMKSQLKSVRHQSAAHNYLRNGSLAIKESRDIFLYSTVTKQAKPKNNNSGGSSTHVSSSGTTHGGTSGSF